MTRHPVEEILGYYRGHTRAGFQLETSDRELVTRVFPGLSGLILLIKPSSAVSFTGNYFFFQRGNLEMRRVGPDFPFVGSIPGGAPPPGRPESDDPKPIQQSLELASSPEPAVPPVRRRSNCVPRSRSTELYRTRKQPAAQAPAMGGGRCRTDDRRRSGAALVAIPRRQRRAGRSQFAPGRRAGGIAGTRGRTWRRRLADHLGIRRSSRRGIRCEAP